MVRVRLDLRSRQLDHTNRMLCRCDRFDTARCVAVWGTAVLDRHAAVREQQAAAAKARGVTIAGGATGKVKLGKTRTGWHGALLP